MSEFTFNQLSQHHRWAHNQASINGPVAPLSSPPPPPSPPVPQLPTFSWKDQGKKDMSLAYIRDSKEAEEIVDTLQGPLGFDLEWRPVFRKGQKENPVAVVQLADADRIMVAQVSAMRSRAQGGFPLKLKEVLEDPTILKVGVGIQGDAKKLYEDWGVSMKGCIELSSLARSIDLQWSTRGGTLIGLVELVKNYIQCTLIKGKVAVTNWEDELSERQQEYAANDAFAGLKVYNALMALQKDMAAPPHPSLYTFNTVNGESRSIVNSAPWKPIQVNLPPKPRDPLAPEADAQQQQQPYNPQMTPPNQIPTAASLQREQDPNIVYNVVRQDLGTTGRNASASSGFRHYWAPYQRPFPGPPPGQGAASYSTYAAYAPYMPYPAPPNHPGYPLQPGQPTLYPLYQSQNFPSYPNTYPHNYPSRY